MSQYVRIGKLNVDQALYEFIVSEALPESGVANEQFWSDFEALLDELTPANRSLLEEREAIQNQLDTWYKDHAAGYEFEEYRGFLEEIGYLEPKVEDFKVATEDVDHEIAHQAGPQLVVPVDNARYALNAANARFGSLYDALYGTDVISEEDGAEQGSRYNPVRGEKVVTYAKEFLDRTAPLTASSHKDVVTYKVTGGELSVTLSDGSERTLVEPGKFKGYHGVPEDPSAILLENHGLHVEIQLDPKHPIGKDDPAGVKDVLVESATTTIMDCEDSVAAVDAEDKVLVYRNLLGLMKGDLTASFNKGGKEVARHLQPDRSYTTPEGGERLLKGRSLMFIRNVGHLMTTPAILDKNGEEVPEGIVDGVVTSLLGKHDLLQNGKYQNSVEGSIYIVKPKMHGSKEVAFANTLFNKVEDMLGLQRHTIKIGVMDEERRTTLNLKNCIHEVKERVVFINTGFLDRTGDEIHTSMEAGTMIRKQEMKTSTWLQSYEQSNVNVGLETGLIGKAQIGKGMWAMPELMHNMMEQKGSQIKAGANTAWVPSPTAASLHALHYHEIDVKAIQEKILENNTDNIDDILQVPVASSTNWSEQEIQQELENNAQGILGYVVRWVNHGVGCSKVPDINNIGLMEDRATLRISSQHMSNWLHHGIVTEEQVDQTLRKMARVVDEQNAHDPEYKPMAPDYDQSIAYQAARDLIFEGTKQPNGYTEPILHKRRRELKEKVYI
ncbi:malate synthase G [Halobacillus andaensis]|uniref:Malate synthase G n=1 Tax=Halobacillus andaensis TaxID=1176239 RepID=A0A917F0H2_HALAA|nr:malate synthase G [Halobacillus andaensis]MBP2006716.1 malate synthase [Halobacillus andaensis]GGF36131.1 malate synthase G [Halobacillus andaensis]